jgi:hypothetical protein
MIYTDGIHMVADSLEELHEFATRIGLKRIYFHGVRKGHPHYDLVTKKSKKAALEGGAVEVNRREILERSKLIAKPKKIEEIKTPNNHKWDKIDDVCLRCGLRRKVSLLGDGMVFKVNIGMPYVYLVDRKWSRVRPDCGSYKQKNH